MPNEKAGKLALRSAMARRDHWLARERAAQNASNEEHAREAARFVAEYEEFIAELEMTLTASGVAE